MMMTGELVAALKDEQARGVQGKATQIFWGVVMDKLYQLSTREVKEADCEDLAQRAAIAVWRKIHAFDYRGPDTFSGWLREIVRLEALAMHRKGAQRDRLARRLEREPVPPLLPGLSSVVFTDQQRHAIEQAKKLLSPIQRESLEYADTHALAKAKNILVDTARKQRRRAVRRLRGILRQWSTWRVRIPTSKRRL